MNRTDVPFTKAAANIGGSGRFLPACVLLLAAPGVSGASGNLRCQFTDPPPEARRWVYWFWLDGNITREGITADLEAMARVGIGGVLIMELAQGNPKGPVAFAGPQRWTVEEIARATPLVRLAPAKIQLLLQPFRTVIVALSRSD